MNYPKLYTYFLPPVLPEGSGTGANLAAGTKIKFPQNNFFDKIKIVAFSFFDENFLSKTPDGYFVTNQISRLNVTLVNNRQKMVVDNIPADVFYQRTDTGNLPNGLIRKIKPFRLNLQKSYLTTNSTVSDLLFIGINFWYYEV